LKIRIIYSLPELSTGSTYNNFEFFEAIANFTINSIELNKQIKCSSCCLFVCFSSSVVSGFTKEVKDVVFNVVLE